MSVGVDAAKSVSDRALSVLLAIRRSLIAFIVTIGLLCLLLSVLLSTYVLESVAHGVLAGIFAIWGVSALLYAALGHIGLRLIGYH